MDTIDKTETWNAALGEAIVDAPAEMQEALNAAVMTGELARHEPGSDIYLMESAREIELHAEKTVENYINSNKSAVSDSRQKGRK